MLDHFYLIDSMTSNDAPKKRSFWGCKTTLLAAKCAPPDSLQDDIRGHKTNDFVDSLYYCITTMTTVGYGDLVPHTFDAQILSSIFITVGMFLFGIAVKIAAKYLVVKQQMVMVNALRTAQKIGPVEAHREIDGLKIDYNKHLLRNYHHVNHRLWRRELPKHIRPHVCHILGIDWNDQRRPAISLHCKGITDVERRKLAKRVIASNITAKKYLEAVEDGNAYGAADMILYKLKEMGKIKEDDVSVAMKDLDDVIKDVNVDDMSGPAKSTQEK
ncbi:hypothetical protein F3Y22_tig00117056pilonHSYRG01074 [Hibiscus syriacus]|uniref:Potassium channel domain-containing protein n=1 Tax=Hibiscus syriacus TaxID=106335 RepID=A0A6A2XK43_HIBSY|nr:hypothetical protein F3Y22_tig00117056pilonHSYRG01074 [Hibiscus syriacus]